VTLHIFWYTLLTFFFLREEKSFGIRYYPYSFYKRKNTAYDSQKKTQKFRNKTCMQKIQNPLTSTDKSLFVKKRIFRKEAIVYINYAGSSPVRVMFFSRPARLTERL